MIAVRGIVTFDFQRFALSNDLENLETHRTLSIELPRHWQNRRDSGAGSKTPHPPIG
jgi:hypothetical protein